jgi:CHAD domain-containing protein
MRLPADLLRRTPDEGARLLALFYLDQASAAERRLADPEDRDALHDFRVGLRRLRSCIRAYRRQLGDSVPKRIRRQLRELASVTNPVRDAEVQLAWLHQQSTRLDAAETEGLAWLIGRLEGRTYEALDRRIPDVGQQFLRVAARLRRRLSSYRIEVRTGRGRERASMAQVCSRLVRQHAGELAARLGQIKGPADIETAHTARIRAKRLRYLLEPLGPRLSRSRPAVRRLKELQDLLGHLHDMQVLGDEIADSIPVFSRQTFNRPGGALPGLLALQRLAQEQVDTSFTQFQTQWTPLRAARFFGRIEELGQAVEQSPSTRTSEPRRLRPDKVERDSPAEDTAQMPTLTINLAPAGHYQEQPPKTLGNAEA